MLKIYFAHPVSDFGTPFEERVVQSLAVGGFEVVNPNSPEHQAGYAARSFKYTKEVRAGCDICAFLRFPNGKLGTGVASEVADFRKRGLPIYEIDPATLALIAITEPPDEVLPPDLTREETALMKALPNGGRATFTGSEHDTLTVLAATATHPDVREAAKNGLDQIERTA